jgi:uncharacterized protein YjbI with pentapeptide repeats
VPETQSQSPAVGDPRALLASANDASGPARNAWLAFLGLLAYLLVTLAGVTHADLLLNSPVTLPIINVKIPLFSFFLSAPFLFLLVHLGLLVQHAILAHKYQQFSAAIAISEEARSGDHPDRQLVHNYVFSQIVAGPKPPWPLHMLMRLMVFVTFSLLPVLVLLYFQIKFLPYHDVAITHAHRIAIQLNVVLLFGVRPFIAMPHLWSHRKILSLGNQSWRWKISYTGFGIGGALCLIVVSFSVLVATVPEAGYWPSWKTSKEQDNACMSRDREPAQRKAGEEESGEQPSVMLELTKWLFEGEPNPTSGTPESLFSRNLIVTDKDLVAKRDFETGETSLRLRGRDLRFAVLDRSDLRRADLYNSDLRGASAFATRLDHVNFEKANLLSAKLQQAKMQGANLRFAEMPRANLCKAKLQDVDFREAKLQGANFRQAEMQGADLSEANMQGADLNGARLQGANFYFAQMQGAGFFGAEMQGANFFAAKMQGADFTAAKMQGANLRLAHLQGANLKAEDLRGTDLREAHVWRTTASEEFSHLLASPSERTTIKRLSEREKKKLVKLITEAEDKTLRKELEGSLGPLLDNGAANNWEGSSDHQAWLEFATRPGPDAIELSNYLAELACNDGSGGYIIRGIARRFVIPDSDYAKLTATRLINKETCPAAKHLSEETRASLKKIAAP